MHLNSATYTALEVIQSRLLGYIYLCSLWTWTMSQRTAIVSDGGLQQVSQNRRNPTGIMWEADSGEERHLCGSVAGNKERAKENTKDGERGTTAHGFQRGPAPLRAHGIYCFSCRSPRPSLWCALSSNPLWKRCLITPNPESVSKISI